MRFFAKGKRGVILKEGNLVIKKAKPATISNESFWIKKLNKYYIGPKFISKGEDYFSYRFVKGIEIIPYITKSSRMKVNYVIHEVLRQCRRLDKLKVNKKEMHHPVKHILIQDLKLPKVTMIDFERCKITEYPKNVTQFCQFLVSEKIKKLLKSKKIFLDAKDIKESLLIYKKDQSDKNFKNVLKLF